MVTNKELKERVDHLLTKLDKLEDDLYVKRLRDKCILGGSESKIFVPSTILTESTVAVYSREGEFCCYLSKNTVKKLWKAIK